MINAKLNLLTSSWNDLVFKDRNKAYGAYVIRMKANSDLRRALVFGVGLFLLAIGIPLLISQLQPREKTVTMTIEDPVFKPVDLDREKKIMPPISVSPHVKSHKNLVRLKPPVVRPYNEVSDDVPTVASLKEADPGPAIVIGDPDAAIAIEGALAEQAIADNITGSSTDANEIFVHVEVQPAFPGGMKAFMDYIAKNYRYPKEATENGLSGKIFLSFVVEKDGSLSHIRVIRDLGYKTGEEAVRLLKDAPKWKPGIQNGRPVRVSYQLPIQLNLN